MSCNSDNIQDNDAVPERAPEISVIMPIYNVADYLRECLDSVESQTYKDWECILVDDGSPDGSCAICDEYAARDPRFRVFHQKNRGVSAARNIGLRNVRGRYLAFIDPDDSVYPMFLERLRDLIVTTGADAVQVGYEQLFTTFTKKRPLVKEQTTLNRAQVVKELMHNSVIPSYLCNKIFRREVVDTEFPEGMVFEDIYVLSHWVRNIRKMVLSPDILYVYRQRIGSITKSADISNRMAFIQSVIDRAKVLQEIEPDAVSDKFAEYYIWKGLNNAGKAIARSCQDSADKYDYVRQIGDFCKTMPMPCIQVLGFKQWWRAYLLRNHPALFIENIRLGYGFHFKMRRRARHFFR